MTTDRYETLDFIGSIARDMGKPLYVMENYPSGYWIDFPPAVEAIMESVGKDAAEAYVRETFRRGNCEDAMARAHQASAPSSIRGTIERIRSYLPWPL